MRGQGKRAAANEKAAPADAIVCLGVVGLLTECWGQTQTTCVTVGPAAYPVHVITQCMERGKVFHDWNRVVAVMVMGGGGGMEGGGLVSGVENADKNHRGEGEGERFSSLSLFIEMWLVSWYFEPSQPQRITSRLTTMFSLSPIYSALKSSKFSKN